MRKALFIGINDYDRNPLEGCAQDAISLARILRKNYDGSPNFHCKILIAHEKHDYSPEREEFGEDFVNEKFLDRAFIKRNIQRLFQGEGDVAILFFSGHGFEHDIRGALMTQDARNYEEGILFREILEMATAAKHIREIIILLDCCYSAQIGNVNNSIVEETKLRKGIAILTSSLPYEYSYEKNGRGMFTSVLHAGFKGSAGDDIGRINSANLYDYVNDMFTAFEQRPTYKANVTSLATLRCVEPKVSLDWIRQITNLFENPDSRFQLSPEFEPTEAPRNKDLEDTFRVLQKLTIAGMVKPSNKEHMYWEALSSGTCELTWKGRGYWTRVKNNMI